MKLSIITINFNNLAGLKRTYDSVICQTWTDYEWIIIDGGSTDGSREFIEQHQDKFAYWCSEPDKGVYNAMNKGITQAKGEFINFMNSGDCFYDKNVLGSVFKTKYEEDIIIGQTILQNMNSEIIVNDASCENYDYLFFATNSIPHQATFYKRVVFDKYGLYNEQLMWVGDWEHAIRSIYLGSATTKYLPMKICLFEGNGISTDRKMYEERRKVMNTIFPRNLQDNFYRLYEYQKENILVNKYLLTHYMYLFVSKFSSFLNKIGLT